MYIGQKDIDRSNKDLVELHKRCITTLFIQRGIKAKHRKKFFKLYDLYVNYKNIRMYFFRDLDLFMLALVKDRLEDISDYFPRYIPKKPKKKK